MVRDDLIMVVADVNGHNTFWYLYNYKTEYYYLLYQMWEYFWSL